MLIPGHRWEKLSGKLFGNPFKTIDGPQGNPRYSNNTWLAGGFGVIPSWLAKKIYNGRRSETEQNLSHPGKLAIVSFISRGPIKNKILVLFENCFQMQAMLVLYIITCELQAVLGKLFFSDSIYIFQRFIFLLKILQFHTSGRWMHIFGGTRTFQALSPFLRFTFLSMAEGGPPRDSWRSGSCHQWYHPESRYGNQEVLLKIGCNSEWKLSATASEIIWNLMFSLPKWIYMLIHVPQVNCM